MLLNVTHAHCVIVCVDGKSLYSVIIKFAGCVCVLKLTCAIVSSSRSLIMRYSCENCEEEKCDRPLRPTSFEDEFSVRSMSKRDSRSIIMLIYCKSGRNHGRSLKTNVGEYHRSGKNSPVQWNRGLVETSPAQPFF